MNRGSLIDTFYLIQSSIKHFSIRLLIKFILIIYLLRIGVMSASDQQLQLSDTKIQRIEKYIEKNITKGKIPGLSIIITNKQHTIYDKGFGYANIENEEIITSKTLFELGSTSKAYTGLGILYLRESGLLNLEDPVSMYIKWFNATYAEEKSEIRIKHLLYHTSGIPFETIGDIPISNSENAIELTVKNLADIELDHKPGDKYLYATINYDILGHIIEKVTNRSFEDFIYHEILQPLQLNNTYINRKKAYQNKYMATGYKYGYLSPREYYAPSYRGNTPAGYFISNNHDIANWLKIQSGSIEIPKIFKKIIKESHRIDNSVLPSLTGSSYAAGWNVYPKGNGEISHGGSNPNFSSYFVIRPADKIGVAVLSNINSSYTYVIGQGIMEILKDKEPNSETKDMYQVLDRNLFVIFIVSLILSLITLFALILIFIDFFKGLRTFKSFKLKNLFTIFLSVLFLGYLAYCLYIIPNVLFERFPWGFVEVWGPVGFVYSIKLFFISILVLTIYFQLVFYFPKKDEKAFFPLIIISSISGAGNAFLIFIINQAINDFGNYNVSLIVYFASGILIYIIGSKLISTKMVKIANNMIFQKRIYLVREILNSEYYNIEKMEDGKIQAVLNNDTSTVSGIPGLIIGSLTSFITLIICFIYLGTINKYGLLLTLLIILLAVGIYTIAGKSSNKLWEESRTIQNIFYRFVNDLRGGFKELSLNHKRRSDFIEDMEKSCSEFKNKQTSASLKFVNVSVFGELLFTIVIGIVAFSFPYLFKNINAVTVRTFIFVFLYMTGPINGILHTIPQLLYARVSWKRINDFIKEITNLSSGARSSNQKHLNIADITLKLSEVEFTHQTNEKEFKVGPINLQFNSGEITFITGGNGSGKTTLAKLLTGLYKPASGSININNEKIHHTALGEYFSLISSDFYLFKKLYGLDTSDKKDEIDRILEYLQINNKVRLVNGEFSTIELSQGQKKRLALLISYIDDKEIILFDEWAADQEPEFRKYFYDTLIHELKRKNKCVIAITHDDHYFHYADKIIKMDMGKIDNIIKNKDSITIK